MPVVPSGRDVAPAGGNRPESEPTTVDASTIGVKRERLTDEQLACIVQRQEELAAAGCILRSA